jgi:hypothetical protein
MKLLLLGYICGLATAIWLLRKQLFKVTDYPDLGDLDNIPPLDIESKPTDLE